LQDGKSSELLDKLSPFSGRSLTPSEERLEVEQAALVAAKRWLEQNGFSVKEVAAYDVGCDLWLEQPGGLRTWVEVKGRSGLYPIQLTAKQWERAQEKQDWYWLIIVLVDGQDANRVNSMYLIKNPSQIPFERKEIKTIEYGAPPEIWTEHSEKLFG